MKLPVDLTQFRYPNGKPFKISKAKTSIKKVFKDEAHYWELMNQYGTEIDELQMRMFAENRRGLLLIFQAMDAAGKDSTIKAVMSGVNTHGVQVNAFKRPTEAELDHDFLWRTTRLMPPRGRVGIFNRSYYEEVLVCRVHPEIVTDIQRLPPETTGDLNQLFEDRLRDIASFEAYCHRNGIHIVKFFLNVSKKEQKKRFLQRIDTPSKNWKFEEGDVKERSHWDAYMAAYQATIRATATDDCPWYVIPADNKKNMRLLVSTAVVQEIEKLRCKYPKMPDSQQTVLARSREFLMNDLD